MTECGLAVKINNTLDNDLQFKVVSQTNNGLFFIADEGVSLVPDHRQSSNSSSMGRGESRNISFPYEIDKTTRLSGEYVIQVAVFQLGSDTSNESLFKNRKKVFIEVDHRPHFLSSQNDFDALFSNNYLAGNIDNLFHFIELTTNEEQPTEGNLFVKVVSEKDGYVPQVTVNVKQGVIQFYSASLDEFKSLTMTQSIDMINDSGSRVLIFPFQIAPNSENGEYFITVTLQDGKANIVDTIPYRITVSSSPIKSWLSVEKETMPPIPPTPTHTPAPTHTPTPSHTPGPTHTPAIKQPFSNPEDSPLPATETCLIPDASCIISPQMNAIASGIIEIRGSANIENFDYYKFEYRLETGTDWSILGDKYNTPVINGLLGRLNIQNAPSGRYFLRLRVVDKIGNYWSPEQEPMLLLNVEN